jgi:hypothetical protein
VQKKKKKAQQKVRTDEERGKKDGKHDGCGAEGMSPGQVGEHALTDCEAE